METWMALLIGVLYAVSFYLLLARSLAKVLLGLLLFGQGINMLIFTSGGLTRGSAAILDKAGNAPIPAADPLPQALILTAIVIGLGVIGFSLALFRKLHEESSTVDLDTLKED